MNESQSVEKAVLTEARSWLGTPYVHQASCKHIGCDCLGLIRGIWRELYGEEPSAVPNYSPDWGQANGQEEMLNAANFHFVKDSGSLKVGSLIIFRWRPDAVAKHAGIYSADNRFIHAYERVGVTESPLNNHWKKRVVAQFRFPKFKISKGS